MASKRRTTPIATVPRRKQGSRDMEARSIMEGELSSTGPQGLSNSRVTVSHPASPNLRRLLLWIFPLIYAIFYAPEYISRSIRYSETGDSQLNRQNHAETSR